MHPNIWEYILMIIETKKLSFYFSTPYHEIILAVRKEGNVLFNDALNTF